MTKKPVSPPPPPSPDRGRKLAVRTALCISAASLAFGLVTHGQDRFGFDGLFGFHALLGFGAGAALVLLAGLAGVLLKRDDDFYDR
ncbi:hypothetical protein [Desulfolutivibrio sulfoxidireducens]|uniref:hypothetical protein n=1 Tax=Desulfolutivibrio sulfoxidireducens TaxID=2773299 RepID=UPI00159D61C1|nr:hypothetical protein [Desulfolutivibrio sulfoxidireducens]QLA17587.1 hypothetical protein GD605_16620 [Desulfolutivibrio sulfoxidireducens]QLA21165.1 hypothetical protein GD604_16265 [Desulfolutivibrio sulfoxidireducens]